MASVPTFGASPVRALLKDLDQQKRTVFHKLLGTSLSQAYGCRQFEAVLAALRGPQIDPTLENLYSSLERVDYFAQVVLTVTRDDSTAALIWGAAQIVVEVASNTTKTAKTLGLLASFNAGIPLMKACLIAQRTDLVLPLVLVRIYQVYLDFCASQVEFLGRKSWRKWLGALFLPSQVKLHNKAVATLQEHSIQFLQWTQSADLRPAQQETKQTNASSESTTPNVNSTPRSRTSKGSSASQVEFPIHSIDLFRNHTFILREELMEEIHKLFTASNKEPSVGPRCCVLHGLGGIGKTTLAKQYCLENKGLYQVIFVIRAESEAEMKLSFCSLAAKLRLEGAEEPSRAIPAVKDWLVQTDKKWLLVFDNALNDRELDYYWPANASVTQSILIATQKSHFATPARSNKYVPVTSFNPADGEKALLKHLTLNEPTAEERAIAREVSIAVGGLPLALFIISGYLLASKYSLLEFLDQFREASSLWQNESKNDEQDRIGTVFRMDYEKIDETARHLLDVLAFLGPEKVHEDIIYLQDKTKPTQHMDLIQQLARWHLVVRQPNDRGTWSLTIHPSLQLTLLHGLTKKPQDRMNAFRDAFAIVRRQMPTKGPLDFYQYEAYPQIRGCITQLLSLHQGIEISFSTIGMPRELELAILFSQAGVFLWEEGLAKDCRIVLQSAEAIFNDLSIDPLAPERADVLTNLGIICSFEGAPFRAEHLSKTEEALRLWTAHKKSLDTVPEAVDVSFWCAWADYACAVLETEDFDTVGSIMDEFKEQCDTWDKSSSYYPWYESRYYHHKSFVLMARNKCKKAVRMARKAAKLQARVSGLQSSLTQQYRFTWAQHLYYAGKFDQSLRLFKRILMDSRKYLGNLNHITITTCFACGVLNWINGNKATAELLIRESLQPPQRFCWPEAYQTRARFYLSKLLRSTGGAIEEAEKLELEATEAKDLLSKKHPAFVVNDPCDERAAFDSLVGIWDLRLTSKLHGNRKVPTWF